MTRYFMNLCTGSVATEQDWYDDYCSMSHEEWGGYSFKSADLVEVELDEDGDWVASDEEDLS